MKRRQRPWCRPALWLPLAVLCLLTACKPAPLPPPAAQALGKGEFPWTADWAQATPDTAGAADPAAAAATAAATHAAAAAGPARWALQVLGDIEREDGQVERSYQVSLHNGAQPLQGLLATVTSATAGVRVQQGLLVVGDVAPGATRTAQRSLTLVHAADRVLQPAELAWALSADAALHDRAGALLPGRPEQPATEGLRLWQPPLPAGWRVQATLHPQARLAAANQALQARQLRIAQMRPGNHTLWLHPVGSTSAELLQRSAKALQDSGAFLQAQVVPPPAALLAQAAAADAGAKDVDPHACQD